MDDQRFDDKIKSKIGGYEDPQFDPAALAALHYQMAAVSVVPWYSRYQTEFLVGSGIALSTLIILWSQWFMIKTNTESLDKKIIMLQAQQSEIDKLQNQISTLKRTPPDTIRIIEIREQPSSYYSSLLNRIMLLETEAANRNVLSSEHQIGSKNISEAVEQPLSPETIENGFSTVNKDLYGYSFSWRLSPRTTERESLRAEPDNEVLLARSTSQNLSAKTLRDLENHYQKGIGIKLGPAVEISKGMYNAGNGVVDITGGVLADFILSPSFSLETGTKFVKRVYEISGEDLSKIKPVHVNETLGTLEATDVDSWIFEIPINLKYRYPLSIKTHWLGGIGYTSLIYTKQILEHGYAMDSNPDASIVSSYQDTRTRIYPGTLNFSLGVSNQLKNKKILETSIYYQKGLGKAGIEENTVNFLGIRSVYWFTVK